MYDYNIAQWFLFFVIYCFAGWIWECSYVSVRTKKLTNRGFLIGPYIPIYGSGAVIILLAALPVKNNIILVFILGMVAASLLEYFTGLAMEAVFKVKYWDYSDCLLNLKGYICLKASLMWGFFSVLLINYVHKPVERFVMNINVTAIYVIAVILAVIMGVDTVVSVKAAVDLKKILQQITENNEEIKRLQKRLDVFIAVAEDEKEKLRASIEEKISEGRAILAQSKTIPRWQIIANPTAKSKHFMEALEQFREHINKIANH